MKPRRFPMANKVFRLPGGNEDNDLWVEQGGHPEYGAFVRSVWEFTPKERQRIANGQNISLTTLGHGTPPIIMLVTPELLGKGDTTELGGSEP